MIETQEYYVVFKEAERKAWYSWFLHEDYGHCYLVWWDGFNWLRMRPNLHSVVFEVLPYYMEEDVEQCVLGKTAVLIEVPHGMERVRYPYLFTVATCTEACKAVLGIRAPWIFTPLQLFNYLIALKHEQWWRPKDSEGE